METSVYEVAVGLIPGIGNQLTRQLVSYCGSAERIFKEKKGKLKKIPGIGEHLAETIVNQNILHLAEKQILIAQKHGIQILFYTSPLYPERLKQIYDAPTLIYYKGNTDLNSRKMLGIVGTRQATSYGKELVQELVSRLEKFQPVIVSGLAHGIDITSHKAALHHNLPTIAVMGTGMDMIYPAAHKEIARKIIRQGGIMTEIPYGTKPEPSFFPARNRIIAGLSDAIIVAEAAEKGGALITAELANGYSREVFAFPGNIGQKYSEGCNRLIKDHKAHILTSAADIEYVMNWITEEETKKKKPLPDFYSDLNEEEKNIIQLMQQSDAILMDDLSWKAQVPVSKLASILLTLEFRGLVKSLPGKKFRLNGN